MKIFSAILFLTILLYSCSFTTSLSDNESINWKQYRGNSALSGYTNTNLPNNPTLKWTYNSNTRTKSSPIVDNGSVFWSDNRGRIIGVDSHGQLFFEYNMNTATESTPLIHDSVLYIGRIDGFISAICLEKQDTLWNYETLGQISASPNIIDFENIKVIVIGSYDSFLYFIDAKSGKLINKFESGYYLNGAAALWQNHVIFGGCDSYIRIIDANNGDRTDSLLLDAYIPVSPAICGNDCFLGDYTGNIYNLKLEKGKIIENNKIFTSQDENSSYLSVPAVSNSTVYFFSDNRNLKALNRSDGTTLWNYMLKGNAGESSPVVCNDKIIVCTKTGIVSILDAKSGTILWEYDVGEQIIGSPAIIKNNFFVLTTRGSLLCFGDSNKN